MKARIIHVAVVCTDLDKSLEFYRDKLGGKVVGTANGVSEEAGIGFGFGGPEEHRAAFIHFGSSNECAAVDLVQFIKPGVTPNHDNKMNRAGLTRIAFLVDDVDQRYNELKEKGVEFISPPVLVDVNSETVKQIKMANCLDPDGTFIELVQVNP